MKFVFSQLENVTVEMESLITNRRRPKSRFQQMLSYSYLAIVIRIVTKKYNLLKKFSTTFSQGSKRKYSDLVNVLNGQGTDFKSWIIGFKGISGCPEGRYCRK